MRLQRQLLLLLVLISSWYPMQAQWMQWESRTNNSLAEFDKYVSEMKDRGYAPVNMSVVTHFNDPRVSSIWQKANINDWACWYGMNQGAFIEKIESFNQNGLSPIDISVWIENGDIRFAAIWQKVGYEGMIEIGMNANELRTKILHYDEIGYSPRDLNSYIVNGVPLYTCIFDRQPRGELNIAYGFTESEIQNEFNALTPEGYYPIDVSYINDNGILKCNGIWAKGNVAWDCRRGYTIDELHNYIDNKSNEGYIPIDIDQYYMNGQFYYGATLTKANQNTTVSAPAYTQPATLPSSNSKSQLRIAPAEQQTEVWCWLATGEMVFKHYNIQNLNPGGNYQCGIIGTIFSNSVCSQNCFNSSCIRGSGSNANTVRMLKDYSWIAANKVFDCTEAYELNFSTIKNNIDLQKPILCGISPHRRQYYQGAEHVVLLTGYEVINQVPYVIINDPYPYPQNDNPYLRSNALVLQKNQYRIALRSFTNDLFWHWSLSNISID